MPPGDKSSYMDKQKRQAQHIEVDYEIKGLSTKTAEAGAWANMKGISGGGGKPTQPVAPAPAKISV